MNKERILIIGGTGTISAPICELLANNDKIDLYVLNRGNHPIPKEATQLICDMNDHEKVVSILSNYSFDIVINFIVFKEQQAKLQIELFKNRIKQYIFISTVATYNHETAVMIKEEHEQNNKYSIYGQNKAACETLFMEAYHKIGFPITIVRPSQTYGFQRIPLSVKGNSCWSVIQRMIDDKPVIVHGDGKSCWHCTHTYDFAHNFVQLIHNEKAIGQVYHNLNPEVYNWDIIYNYIYKCLDKKPNIIHIPSDILALSCQYDNEKVLLGDKQYSCLFDVVKINHDIRDFKNNISIFEGIDMYLSYMENHNELKEIDQEYNAWCDKMIEIYRQFYQRILESNL